MSSSKPVSVIYSDRDNCETPPQTKHKSLDQTNSVKYELKAQKIGVI